MENNMPKEGVNKNVLAISVSVIIICLIVSGAILYGRANSSRSGNNNAVAALQYQDSGADINRVALDNHPFVGQANAPLIMAEWFDYQCPFCKREDQNVLNQVYENYIKTGKVKLVYKDFPFLGPDSGTAAIAGRAVWEVTPDKFYAWHEAMFEKQAGENSGWASKANILALTQSLGIDSEKVGQLMASKAGEYQKSIDADKAEASGFGISGTPSFIVGKQLVIGAQPFSTLQTAIDSQLK